jgi:hypothetical protein
MRCWISALLLSAAVAGAQEPAPDSTVKPKAPPRVRRIPLTPALENSAFKDATARALLARARAARLSQDSALRAYDARSYLRVSVGMRIARLGPERLRFRTEIEIDTDLSRIGQRGAFTRIQTPTRLFEKSARIAAHERPRFRAQVI